MNLFEKFNELNGAKLVGIQGYTNKNGELSNQVINCNVNIENAKKKDLEALKTFPASKLNEIAKKVGASKEDALRAIEELIEASERNLSSDNRTAQSIAQSEAYTKLGKGLKFHNETGDLYVTGFLNKKTVLVKGSYKVVNSSAKTLVKKEVNKGLRMAKYRSFVLRNGKNLAVTGSTIQLG